MAGHIFGDFHVNEGTVHAGDQYVNEQHNQYLGIEYAIKMRPMLTLI